MLSKEEVDIGLWFSLDFGFLIRIVSNRLDNPCPISINFN